MTDRDRLREAAEACNDMTHEFRQDGSHYNGGEEFFGYGYRAVGEPRLKMVRRWYRQGEKRGVCEDHFFVDGDRVEHYAAAMKALRSPPTFSADEIAALRQIGDEPADHREAIDWRLTYSLGSKGAIEWGPPGRCKRTDLGRSVAARALADADDDATVSQIREKVG